MKAKYMWLLTGLALVAVHVPSGAFANTGVFFGAGNQVMPIKNTDIQLVEEHVSITLRIDDEKGKWGIPFFPRSDVTAVFQLKNTSDNAIDVQLGFPFLDLQGFGDEKVVLDKMLFTVRGEDTERTVSLKEGVIEASLDPEGLFKKVYVWSEHFGPSEFKTLTVSYRLLMSVASASTIMRGFDGPDLKYEALDRLFPAISFSFMYITKTAYTWKPPVAKAVFEVDCRDLLAEFNSEQYISKFGEEIPAPYKRPVLLADFQPEGSKSDAGVLRWEFAGSVPEKGIGATFITLFIPAESGSIETFVNSSMKKATEKLTRAEVTSVLRSYYARIAGLPINDEDEFAAGYFRPVEIVKTKLLFPQDKQVLTRIHQDLQGTSGSR